jgi:choline-sulfatase
MSDQHHAGVMGCAGDPVAETPVLDRLAASGARFTNAYCPFPLCGPSRMSFMTGRHPYEIGVWDNEVELHSDIPTCAHAFLAAGYDTALAGRMHFVGWDQRHGFAERIIGDVPESVYLAAG